MGIFSFPQLLPCLAFLLPLLLPVLAFPLPPDILATISPALSEDGRAGQAMRPTAAVTNGTHTVVLTIESSNAGVLTPSGRQSAELSSMACGSSTLPASIVQPGGPPQDAAPPSPA